MQRDKKKHLWSGFLAGWTGWVMGIVFLNEWWAIAFAIAFATIAGLWKEFSDKDTTGFDWRDLAATEAGGLIVAILGLGVALSGINDFQGILLR